MSKIANTGDPLTNWSKENVFLITPGDILIAHEAVPILQYGLNPGSIINVRGKLRRASDAPKQCFKSVFVKDAGLVTDYFACKDCNFNWICKSCMEVCHKGHTVVEYIQNHKPTWACCYCVKKGKCVLFHQ